MSTTLFPSQRRLLAGVSTIWLAVAGLCGSVKAQTPAVVVSFPTAVPHNESFGAPWQSAVSNRGDFLVFDFKTSGLYEYPANGGPEITIAAPGVIAGGFSDSGIAVDPRNNNLYLNNNYNGGLLEFPFDTQTGMWDLPKVTVANNLGGNLGGSCGNYFQGAGLSINDNGVMAVATENGCGVEIFTVPIDTSGNFGSATAIVSHLTNRAKTVAIDDLGNISFNEDTSSNNGVLFIPAGTTGLNGEATIQKFFSITPNPNGTPPVTGNNVQGVTVDTAGNLYVADQVNGLFLVPLEGGAPNPAQATLLSPALAGGGPAIDSARGIIFMPLAANVGTIKDAVKIYLNRTEFGSGPVGGKAATAGVTYYFDSGATPYNFSLVQGGAAGAFALGDLSKCGVVIATDSAGNTTHTSTPYAAGATCTLPITFTPSAVGDASATLLMLDKNGDVLNSTLLHGSGLGSQATISPNVESRLFSGLKTPSQIAVDTAGNLYIADSGLGKVLEYAKGATASASLGKGLTAPTGVAVDGTGNVFIADSGNLIEVPNGPDGLNAAGQVTLKTGLGTNLKLAADAIGDVFVTDPDNGRVVRLRNIILGPATETDTAGFGQATAIAANGAGDFYVANGSNLVEVSSAGNRIQLGSLSGANGLAVDPSGSVYVTSTNQTVRLPNIGGSLSAVGQIVLATGVTKPTSVALDSLGNAYVTDAAAGNVDAISVNGALNLGALGSTTATATSSVVISDDGNQPLNVTAFSSSVDYAVTSTTCAGNPVAVGGTCAATVTFKPGAGDQGTLTAQLTATTDAINAPVVINTTGVGFALAASTTTFTAANANVTGAPVTVKVAPTSGTSPVPTGTVTVTVTAAGYSPVVVTQPLVNGAAAFNETAIPAGMDTFTVNYSGDRVYGTSTANSTISVGTGAITLMQPASSTVPTYVLSAGTGSAEPYDGSQGAYLYVYPMTIHTANGAPLVGVPQYDSNKKLTGYNYGTVTLTQASGTPVCAPVNVQGDGTVVFAASCVNIDTSNNQIPNIATPYTLTPTYNGANYTSVTGTSFSFTAIRNPSVLIAASPNTLTVSAGSSASTNLTVTSLLGYGVTGANSNLNNYSLPVEMGCSGLPAHSACSFSYPTPDPSDANSTAVTPTAPGHVVMTINTNVAVGTTTAEISHGTITFAALAGMGLLGLAFGGRKKLSMSLPRLACVLLLAGAAAGLTSCGTTNINQNPVLTTPKGNYTVTVTAKQAGSKQVPPNTPGGAVQTVYGSGNQMSMLFTMNVTVQ